MVRKEKVIDQEFIDAIFSITIMIRENPWLRDAPRDKVQDWVAKQLALFDVFTVPIGMSWGALCTEEFYNEYLPNIKKDDKSGDN